MVWALVYMISMDAPLFRIDFNTQAECEKARQAMSAEFGGAYGKIRALCIPNAKPQ